MTIAQESILLVEDDAMTRGLLGRYLERAGLAVTGVADGATALRHLDQGRFDLVLLDIGLEGMSGLEVLRALRSRHSTTDLPVVMATARDKTADIVTALEMGASDYVTKPFDYPVVLARVRTHLALKRSVDQIRQLEQSLGAQNALLEEANARMRRDLEAAALYQQTLLPADLPLVDGVRFAWRFRPCTELAGDLLNIIPLSNGRIALYVLDVAGHGVAAALLAVTVNRVLTQLCSSGRLTEPAEVATLLSREFNEQGQPGNYFTLLYGLLDLERGLFRFVAAGHPGPLALPRNATGQNFRFPGVPIGWGEESYQEQCLNFQPGDRLYLYSDGILEAFDEHSKPFGVHGVLGHLEQGRAAPLADTLDHLLRGVQDWCGAADPHDDISLLAVERT